MQREGHDMSIAMLEFALSYGHDDVIREQFSEDIIREIQPELEKLKKERGLT